MEIIFIFILWLVSLIAVILTSYRVWGLRGGWGGFYMREAIYNRRRAWAAFIVISTLLFSVLFNLNN